MGTDAEPKTVSVRKYNEVNHQGEKMTVGVVIFHKINPMQLGEPPSVLKLGCARLFNKRKAGLESLLDAAPRSPLAPARPPADLCGAQQWLLGPGL